VTPQTKSGERERKKTPKSLQFFILLPPNSLACQSLSHSSNGRESVIVGSGRSTRNTQQMFCQHFTASNASRPIWNSRRPKTKLQGGKKRANLLLSISSSKINRFSKFFYWCILWTISNNVIIEYPAKR